MPFPGSLSFTGIFIFKWINHNTYLYISLAIALLLMGGMLLMLTLREFNLMPKNSLLPFFIYVVLMSCVPDYLTFHPVLLTNIIFILVLLFLFKAGNSGESLKEIFVSGLLIALASLFLFKSAGMILLLLFFLLIHRNFGWRHWLVGLIGFACVYVYLFSWFLMTGQVLEKLAIYKVILQSIGMISLKINLQWQFLVLIILVFILSLASLIHFLIHISDKVIHIRRNSMVILWFFLTSLVVTTVYIVNIFYDIAFLVLPVTILISIYFNSLRKMVWAELLFFALMAMIVIIKIY